MTSPQSEEATGVADAISSGLHVGTQIVPVVRRWLERGISEPNLKSSVRIRELKELPGGLKSPGVAALTIHVKAIIKQGSDELLQHKKLMNGVNVRVAATKPRGVQVAIFPEVMAVELLADLPMDRNYLMVQQELVDYESLQSLLYTKKRMRKRVLRATKNALVALKFIHSLPPDPNSEFADLPQNLTPFAARISDRLDKLRSIDWLNEAFLHGCDINGRALPPLDQLLQLISEWEQRHSKDFEPCLVHGDPHLANLMARPAGNGESVRWIDPNPTIGFSDPAYDWGKLLHFVEPVGLAKESAEFLNLRVRMKEERPIVVAELSTIPKGVERARKEVDFLVRSAALEALVKRPIPEAVLAIAIASAHVGYAAVPIDANLSGALRRAADKQRKFALAWSLDALARWVAACDLDA